MGRSIRARVVSPFVSQGLRMIVATANADGLGFLKELIEAAKVTPVIDRTYALSEVPDAIRYLTEGHARGKLVITVRRADRRSDLRSREIRTNGIPR